MEVQFYKYQGAGNDFVVVDNRNDVFDRQNTPLIAKLCHRRFGIGADGLMLLQNSAQYDFEMIYFNSDGKEGSMCGNGGRCIVAFAKFLDIIDSKTVFLAVDGPHEAELRDAEYVRLKMNDLDKYEEGENYYFMDTGSPHYVEFTTKLNEKDVYSDGRKIRYNERFTREGTNVNFVEFEQDGLFVRTYERGVENETFACGTGVVASSISAAIKSGDDVESYNVRALGGNLKVRFEKNGNGFKNVWLEGPACQVFAGKVVI